jgi:hypothetical protein
MQGLMNEMVNAGRRKRRRRRMNHRVVPAFDDAPFLY